MEYILENSFLLLLLVVLAVYYIFFRLMPYIKRMRNSNEGEEDFVQLTFNPSSTLSTEEYKKISIGAIYSEMQEAYINSLSTGLDDEMIRMITQDWWGIYNRETALETLNYLKDKGFNYYFPSVYKAFLSGSTREQEKILLEGLTPQGRLTEKEKEVYKEDLQKALSQVSNLQNSYNELKEEEIINSKEDIQFYGVLGWDYGRLSYLSRICFDANYLTEKEAWNYIDEAYFAAQEHFTSWDDFAKSYVIGRAAWSGVEEMGSIAHNLLNNPESPWVKISW